MEHNKLENVFVKKDDFDCKEKNGFINFVDTVGLLLEYRYGEYEEGTGALKMPIVYSMYNPEGMNSKDKELPHIVYNLNNLRPGRFGEDTRDIKQRTKSVFTRYSELLQEDVQVIRKSQIIDAEMTFTIYGDNEDVYRWSSRLRNLINEDIAFFEDAGIFKILWIAEDDKSSSYNGKHYSARSITYFFQYEDVTEKEVYKITGLNLRLRALLNKRQLRGEEPPALVQNIEFKKKKEN